jgi:hypothetical protein
LAPNSTAALRSGSVSSSSPVAIRITRTALPITSAGRFWPCGPLGIGLVLLGALDPPFLAGNLPFGISLDASALLVGLREASLGLGDYLANWGGWLMVWGTEHQERRIFANNHTPCLEAAIIAPRRGIAADCVPLSTVPKE